MDVYGQLTDGPNGLSPETKYKCSKIVMDVAIIALSLTRSGTQLLWRILHCKLICCVLTEVTSDTECIVRTVHSLSGCSLTRPYSYGVGARSETAARMKTCGLILAIIVLMLRNDVAACAMRAPGRLQHGCMCIMTTTTSTWMSP